MTDEGQSVQSDGRGDYVHFGRPGETRVILLDSSTPRTPDYFMLHADTSGESPRFLRLRAPADSGLLVNTDCASAGFRVFSNSDPNWFNSEVGTVSGSADLHCDAGRNQGTYKVTWTGCIEITTIVKEQEFNFKPSSSCTATVRRTQGGSPVSFDVSVPFDISAARIV